MLQLKYKSFCLNAEDILQSLIFLNGSSTSSCIAESFQVKYQRAACVSFNGGLTVNIFLKCLFKAHEVVYAGTKRPDSCGSFELWPRRKTKRKNLGKPDVCSRRWMEEKKHRCENIPTPPFLPPSCKINKEHLAAAG